MKQMKKPTGRAPPTFKRKAPKSGKVRCNNYSKKNVK
jgi:hypothetical protein